MIRFVLLLASGALSSASLAELVEEDWRSPGDGLLTLDTATDLRWLDVTVTIDRSFDDLVGVDGSNEFAAGGDFPSFRHATEQEVVELLEGNGVHLQNSTEPTDPAVAAQVIDLLGGPAPDLPPGVSPPACCMMGATSTPSPQRPDEFVKAPLINQSVTAPGYNLANHVRRSTILDVPAWGAGHFLVLSPDAPVAVAIDVKPGSDPNCFNQNGHGVIPVAILGSDDFDVTQINTNTLIFGGLEVRIRSNKGPLCSMEYVNEDSSLDLVCKFADSAEAWMPGDGEATLTGELYDGIEFAGSDSVCVVPKGR